VRQEAAAAAPLPTAVAALVVAAGAMAQAAAGAPAPTLLLLLLLLCGPELTTAVRGGTLVGDRAGLLLHRLLRAAAGRCMGQGTGAVGLACGPDNLGSPPQGMQQVSNQGSLGEEDRGDLLQQHET
jgi:hypothetical protein